MNWRRGLWRLWLVGSALWIAFFAWTTGLYCIVAYNYLWGETACDNQWAWAAPHKIVINEHDLEITFLPPTVALVVTLLLSWVIAGFRARKSN